MLTRQQFYFCWRGTNCIQIQSLAYWEKSVWKYAEKQFLPYYKGI